MALKILKLFLGAPEVFDGMVRHQCIYIMRMFSYFHFSNDIINSAYDQGLNINCIHYRLLISNMIQEIFVVQYQFSNFNFIQTSKLVAIVLYFLLNFYFILSVEAYIRKIKKRSGMAGEIMLAGTLTFKCEEKNIYLASTCLLNESIME